MSCLEITQYNEIGYEFGGEEIWCAILVEVQCGHY